MDTRGPVLLARYLALAWLGLIIYGSLYPFAGWRDTGGSSFAFLDGAWPRYWTAFDLSANVAVYFPLGFFLTLALRRLPGRFSGLVVAVPQGRRVRYELSDGRLRHALDDLIGVVLAVLSMQFLSSGMNMLQVSNFARELIWGSLLIFVMIMNTWRAKPRKA